MGVAGLTDLREASLVKIDCDLRVLAHLCVDQICVNTLLPTATMLLLHGVPPRRAAKPMQQFGLVICRSLATTPRIRRCLAMLMR